MRFEVIEKRLEEMDAKLTELSHHLDDPAVRSSLDLLVEKRAKAERYHSNNSGGSSIIRISFVSICVQKAANAVVCDRISLNSLTKIVDAIITGLGLFGSMAVIAKLEAFLGVQLFVLPMMSSCIIFKSTSKFAMGVERLATRLESDFRGERLLPDISGGSVGFSSRRKGL